MKCENPQCPCGGGGNPDSTTKCIDPRSSYAEMEQFYGRLLTEIRGAVDHAVASSANLNKELILSFDGDFHEGDQQRGLLIATIPADLDEQILQSGYEDVSYQEWFNEEMEEAVNWCQVQYMFQPWNKA